jgi:hypothetical protein
MSFKNLCILNAIVCLGFGLPMLISTSILTGLFSARPEDINDSLVFIFKLFSVPLISIGVVSLWARNAEPSLGRQALTIYMILSGFGSAIIHIYGITQSFELSSGWGTVILTAIIGGWAVMILNKDKAAKAA